MDFYELQDHVRNISDLYSIETVHFGCECGCGGDTYTEEEWEDIVFLGEKSMQALEKFGVSFNND